MFVRERELVLSRKVDMAVEKYGIKKHTFAKFAFYLTSGNLTALVTFFTCLSCFYKADFINLTVCAVAIHVLINAD